MWVASDDLAQVGNLRHSRTMLHRCTVVVSCAMLGACSSPLAGSEGNREFFLHLSMHGRTAANLETIIDRTVQALA